MDVIDASGLGLILSELCNSPAGVALVSVDVDGTLECGDPPGPIELQVIRLLLARGHIVGSCSDRVIREQRRMWMAAGIEVDFVILKNELPYIKSSFVASRWVHIGDSFADELYSQLAGFEFVPVCDVRTPRLGKTYFEGS